MSLESDEHQAYTPTDLAFILAIAGRIDAQNRSSAENIDDEDSACPRDEILDPLYSTYKYFFDYCLAIKDHLYRSYNSFCDNFLTLADYIEYQVNLYASILDKDRSIHYAYAILDSLSSSYSMFKYFFDLCVSSKDPNAMHDMMMTPFGIIAIVIESIFLVGFSFLAAKFDKEREDPYKKFIATAWPYFRDVMKGLKNAYKGWFSAVLAISLLAGWDLGFIATPIGLVFGTFAAANRFWLRDMVESRKKMLAANGLLKKEIRNLPSLTREERKFYINNLIKSQTDQERIHAYFSVAAGGFLDAFYLYVGILGLVTFSYPMLSAMAAICAIYTAACVVSRIYEEYEAQQKLIITQTVNELELIAKELQTTYRKLILLQAKPDKSEKDLLEIKRLKNEIYWLLDELDQTRNLLIQQSTHSYATAALLGIKNGLYAYGALASILFFTSAALALAGIALPAEIIVGCIILGLVFMMTFTAQSLLTNYNRLAEEQIPVVRPYNKLMDLKSKLQPGSDIDDPELLDEDALNQSIRDGMSVKSTSGTYWQAWFEIFRSLFSGFGKGQKFVGFAGNFMKEQDAQGRYQDTNFMIILEVISAIIFGLILALRAIARGFRAPAEQQEQSAKTEAPKAQTPKPEQPEEPVVEKDSGAGATPAAPVTPGETTGTVPQHKVPGESSQANKPRTDSPKQPSSLVVYGLFETKSKNKNKSSLSDSDVTLTADNTTWQSTIQGLA